MGNGEFYRARIRFPVWYKRTSEYILDLEKKI
jgi:hypothetical protein